MSVGPLESDNGELIVEDKEVADEINKYFSSVFTVEDLKNIPVITVNQEMEGRWEFSEITITREEMLKLTDGAAG